MKVCGNVGKKTEEGDCQCAVPASLSCSLLASDIRVGSVALGKGFVQDVGTVHVYLIMSKLLPEKAWFFLQILLKLYW